jgi:hypothetical protein
VGENGRRLERAWFLRLGYCGRGCLHPHIHCAIPAGGLSADHRRWIRPRYSFFLPVKVLSRVFRGKFLAGLKRLYRSKKLYCAGPTAALADSAQFSKLIRRLHRHDWAVYAKPAFGGPLQVLRYLGRYTHRVAISNHRLLAFEQERITFRWKNYAHGGKQGQMTLVATEFLRRFFLHVLPKGFVHIRHFGFLANRWRASRLALCQELLACNSPTPAESRAGQIPSESSLWHCPRCGAAMIVIQRFTPAELSTCLPSILRSAFLNRTLQTCSHTPIHSCVHFLLARSCTTIRTFCPRHFRRRRYSLQRRPSCSPMLSRFSTRYQTAIQIP